MSFSSHYSFLKNMSKLRMHAHRAEDVELRPSKPKAPSSILSSAKKKRKEREYMCTQSFLI
jgi:hypothetical protein